MFRRRNVAICVLSASVFLMSGFPSSAQTQITTTDGREHAGEIIDAGVNTLMMKLEGTGYQIVPVQSISRIQVDIADGPPIAGRYLDWSEGEIVIRVGDRDVAIRDGYITSVLDVGVAAGGPNVAPSEAAPTEPPSPPQPSPAEPSAVPAPEQDESVPQNATM